MKDIFLFEVEYDEDGNPDIRVTLSTARIPKMTFSIKDIKEPNFEDLPINMQLEKLYTLGVNGVKHYAALASEEITSLKNAQNRRNFPIEVMKSYALIVIENRDVKKLSRFWKISLEECVNYSKKYFSHEIYDAILNTKPDNFRNMMRDYFEKHSV